ncbi:MAG TPA: choice-of-anchor V domain-containing protein [Gammaproteobacteria bacterium]
MPGKARFIAVPIALIGSAFILPPLGASRVYASPDEVEWETAKSPDGCRSCHLGTADAPGPAALTIEGLPSQPEPGTAYALSVILEHPALRNAGFLLSVESNDEPAGALTPTDQRAETNGSSARSTWEGSFPAEPGKARWELVWTAPDPADGPIEFSLWGNAGNDDLSPLGDHPVHRTWQIAIAP